MSGLVTRLCVFALAATAASSASADLADKLSKFVGYTIVHEGTITGYQDDKKKRNDSFEGCEWGRRIFIDHTFQVTCNTYSYTYSFMPKVVIIAKGQTLKMVVGDEVYDISR